MHISRHYKNHPEPPASLATPIRIPPRPYLPRQRQHDGQCYHACPNIPDEPYLRGNNEVMEYQYNNRNNYYYNNNGRDGQDEYETKCKTISIKKNQIQPEADTLMVSR